MARIHIKTLLEEKAKYAKSLQVNSNKDLLTLFESLLSTTDTDPRTEYIFKDAQAGEMHFTFKKMIKIFDFNWTYKLKKVNCNPIELICRELLTPLASALKAQANHLERVKRRF